MSAAFQSDIDAEAIIREGWEVLVKNLGLHRATRFVMLLERGKGDSVKEIAEYWRDATIKEIHSRVMEWKAAQQPNA